MVKSTNAFDIAIIVMKIFSKGIIVKNINSFKWMSPNINTLKPDISGEGSP
jgi:hypothetical protein